MQSLTDKVVLLTGAGGGFGRSLGRLLLAEGCRLILADLPGAGLRQAAGGAAGPGAILGTVAADLGEPAGADALYADAVAISPQIDILVNNAGLAVYGRIDEVPQAAWERLMQVNLLAPMRLTSLALPAMVARRSGHIVNVSSAAGLMGAAGLSAYNASKFGLRGFSESLALDVARHGVHVTTIYPFFTRTPILDSPQYGVARRRALPRLIVGDPDRVMRALVRGIKRRKRHVYPGLIAKAIHVLRRLGP